MRRIAGVPISPISDAATIGTRMTVISASVNPRDAASRMHAAPSSWCEADAAVPSSPCGRVRFDRRSLPNDAKAHDGGSVGHCLRAMLRRSLGGLLETHSFSIGDRLRRRRMHDILL